MKLTKAQAMAALEDVADNRGTMWRQPHAYAAKRAWDDLHSRGLVEWNPWAQAWLPSDAGLSALAEQEKAG